MQRRPLQQLPLTGGDVAAFTPFQQWKVQTFRYTTDTPAGSEHHDYNVVNMVANYLKETRAATRADANKPSTMPEPIEEPRSAGQRLRFSLAHAGVEGEDNINSSSAPNSNSSGGAADSMFVRSRDNHLRRLTLSRVGKLNTPSTSVHAVSRTAGSVINGPGSGDNTDHFPSRPSLSPITQPRASSHTR